MESKPTIRSAIEYQAWLLETTTRRALNNKLAELFMYYVLRFKEWGKARDEKCTMAQLAQKKKKAKEQKERKNESSRRRYMEKISM